MATEILQKKMHKKENSIEILGIWHTSRGTEFEEE